MLKLIIKATSGGGANTAAQKAMLGGLQSDAFKRLLTFRYGVAATAIIADMKRDSPRDTGRLANSHGHAIDAQALRLMIFNRAGYAPFVHEGRRPGKMPPIDALVPWARRHVVNARIMEQKIKAEAGVSLKPRLNKRASSAEQDEARRLAFLVARKIARFGTKPNRWFEGVVLARGVSTVREQVQKAVDDFAQVLADGMTAFAVKGSDKGGA